MQQITMEEMSSALGLSPPRKSRKEVAAAHRHALIIARADPAMRADESGSSGKSQPLNKEIYEYIGIRKWEFTLLSRRCAGRCLVLE